MERVEKPRLKVTEAEFLFGAPRLEAIRKQSTPEVAVIGRSNVGKSSLINRLLGRKLTRVSSRPGSTTELNFYRVGGEFGGAPFAISLVDMPGFGFAKLSKAQREDISQLSVSFLRERKQLRAVILLNDCRRAPQEDEIAVQALCAEEGLACIVVLTKCDVLRQNEKQRVFRDAAAAFGLEPSDLVYSGEGLSSESVWERVLGVL